MIVSNADRLKKAPTLGFRADVQGMRGVAVLLVLSYHCLFSEFPGGYVGVDVFFVISGYLITRILLNDLENGVFSPRDFYVRRIRRLIPSLLVTITLTLLAGLVILSPRHLKELSVSSIFATLSLSNVHFAASGGYFVTSSKIKPLLHTWSLGIEEQFYLLWPMALWLGFQFRNFKKIIFPLIAVLAFCGVMLSEYWIGRNPAQAYFLLPFRAHQLLLGALALGVERRLPVIGQAASTVLCFIGLAMVLASAALYDESTPFPGFASLAPAVGAVLVLVAGAQAPLAKSILGNPILGWIGLLSYSIYLAHWPIIAYAHYLSLESFSLAEKWSLFAASIAAGALLHYGVEARYRLEGAAHRWREARGVALGCAAVLLISAAPIPSQGLPQRMDLVPERRDFAEAMQFEFLRDYRDGVLREGNATSGKTVLIFGDSMMQNYVPALMSLPEMRSAKVTIITRGGCVAGWGGLHVVNGGIDQDCRALRDRIFGDTAHYDLVIWAQSWLQYQGTLYIESAAGAVPAKGDGVSRWRQIIAETLARIEPRSGKIVVVGPQLTIAGVPLALERIGPITDIAGIPATLTRMTEIQRAERDLFEEQLRSLASGSLVLDPRAIVCPEGACRFHDLKFSFFVDPIHFTAAMTPIVAPLIRNELGPVLR